MDEYLFENICFSLGHWYLRADSCSFKFLVDNEIMKTECVSLLWSFIYNEEINVQMSD